MKLKQLWFSILLMLSMPVLILGMKEDKFGKSEPIQLRLMNFGLNQKNSDEKEKQHFINIKNNTEGVVKIRTNNDLRGWYMMLAPERNAKVSLFNYDPKGSYILEAQKLRGKEIIFRRISGFTSLIDVNPSHKEGHELELLADGKATTEPAALHSGPEED